jgi:hypothetical protein
MPIKRSHGWRLPFVARTLARLVWCAIGATAGLGLILWLVNPPSAPLWLASFGGTAVFLFGLTRAPAAQPRALFGGHLSGALIGVLCFQAFGDAILGLPARARALSYCHARDQDGSSACRGQSLNHGARTCRPCCGFVPRCFGRSDPSLDCRSVEPFPPRHGSLSIQLVGEVASVPLLGWLG